MNRKFIAGAVCPRCQQLDKLFMFRRADQLVRECVRCGFSDVLEQEMSTEITTRVSKTPQTLAQSDTVKDEDMQVVKIISPK